MLKAEGWHGPETTVYHIAFRIRRLREKGHPEDVPAKVKTRSAQGRSTLGSEVCSGLNSIRVGTAKRLWRKQVATLTSPKLPFN